MREFTIRGFTMRKISVFLLFLLVATAMVHAASISGDYLESRSADVYVAQCFANGEVGLVGDEATLAWHVQNGNWDGQKLDGLTVMASVKAQATLGDPFGSPYPAKSVILVDEKGWIRGYYFFKDPEKRRELIAEARRLAGKRN